MSERTLQAQRAQDLANRREVATFRLANAAAFAANMLTAEMHELGRLSVRCDLWNALDEWRKLHGLPDGWPIDESLATPEPRGEGAGVVAAASAYLRALDTYRKECRDREIPLAEYAYDEFRRLAEPLVEAEERLRAALRSGAQGEEAAVRRTWELAVQRAYGCLDYCGGYRGAELKAFHSGIKTVIRALEAGLDTVDTQTAALDRIGAALRPLTAARRGEGGGE